LKNEKRSRVTEFRGQGCNLDALELVSPERFVENSGALRTARL